MMTYDEAVRKLDHARATVVPDEEGDVPGHILIREGRPGCTLTEPPLGDPFWVQGILFCGMPGRFSPLTHEDLAARDWEIYAYYF